MRIVFLLFSLFILHFSPALATIVDEDWREDAKLFLQQGKPESALYLVAQALDSATREADLARKVDLFRFIAEIEWMADKQKSAQHHFIKALSTALSANEVWRQLSLSISVLELQKHVVDNLALRRVLLHMTVQRKLLLRASTDKYASEIGRYIQTFDQAADALLVNQLITHIHLIKHAQIRTKALFALNELQLHTKQQTTHFTLDASAHHNAGIFEKFLWHLMAVKLHRISGNTFRQRSHQSTATSLMEQLGKDKKAKAKRLLAHVRDNKK